MFGKKFAYQFQGGEGEGWTPPWLHRGEEWQGPPPSQGHHGPFGHRGPFGHHGPFGHGGPRYWGMHRGRGPFGPQGPFGAGPGGEGPRFFGRGDIKFALLELLKERPMHGYEMIKALEEKSGGFYAPSPGSVYPTLQMLEDRGFVTVNVVNEKKVYTITDTGRKLLEERQQNEERFGPPWMHRRGHGGPRSFPEMQALRSEVIEVTRLLAIAGRMSLSDPEQLARLRGVIERTRKDLSDMIYSANGQAQTGDTPSSTSNQSEGPTVENA